MRRTAARIFARWFKPEVYRTLNAERFHPPSPHYNWRTMRSLCCLLLLLATPLLAQDPRGAIVGQVTDSSGAVIPGVKVRATNAATNVLSEAETNAQGHYELLYLLTGTYTVSIEHAGFKSWTQPNVEVRIGDRLRLDVPLTVGQITETVEVTEAAPVLESTTATLGQVVSSRAIADLPLRSGNLSWLFSTAPGVVLQTLPYDGPWNIAQASGMSVGGAGNNGFDFNVDGVSNNSYDGQTAFVPPADMVQEVRINTASYDAAVGHGTGASINVSLKSGTNALHGTLGASVASGPMLTRNFFTNRFIFDPTTGPITPEKIKANTPSTRWLRYSAAVGGPVYIPKIYNGENRTFWMFGLQAHSRRRPVATTNSVPTAAQRTGDFSSLLALGPQYQIYDPMTTRPEGASRFRRSPLPNNIIPASRIDPAARKILGYFPEPNAAGTADGLNNYIRTRQDRQDLTQPVARLDHNFSSRHRIFGRYSHSDFTGHFDELISGSTVRGRRRRRPHRGATFDNVYVLSPSMVMDTRYGFTWFREYESFDNIGWDLKEFGFPDSLIGQLDPRAISFPQIVVSGLLQLGNNGGFQQTNYSHSLLNVLNWSRGNHSLKFGADVRLLLENDTRYGNVSPRLDFAEAFTRGPLDNSPVAPAGQGLASMLFGIPTGGLINKNDSLAERSWFHGYFVQDDWRVTRKLTLNLGFRWEYESPIVERYNRTTRDFDFTTANPIEAQARANYARAPIPEIPAAQFRTVGGVTFAGVGGNPRGIRDPFRRSFMPRFGYAYQALDKIVLRGGYGVFFDLIGAEFSDVAQPGFNQQTNIVPSLDNGITYVASIANPFPNGLETPRGAAGGLETFLGRSPGFFSEDGRPPHVQRWSQSVQFEALPQTVVEVGYMGTRAARLRVSTNLNPIPARYLSTAPVRDQAAIDFLSARVGNPFAGIEGFSGSSFFGAANTSRSQLLRPYPHFADLTVGLPAGMSWYHALTLRVERRFSHGFQAQMSYTWSKTMEAVAYRNDTDGIPEHVVSNLDRPHHLAITGILDIPFKPRNAVLNHIAGGWTLQGIYQFQSGPPLGLNNVFFSGTWEGMKLTGDARSLGRWFNTGGFERRSNAQPANNIRTLSTRVATVRADGINVVDLSIHKNFQILENLKLQLRGEAEGATNHPNFAAPNINPASTLFGQVTATQTNQEERRIFVGMKLIF
jgi:hypothetical protein